MRYRGLDLNLLIALNALLTTRSVSQAAERAFVTQPAMSAALRRLRTYFGDPLLMPVNRRMVLTPAAESLVGPVADLLRQVDATILTSSTFDPAVSRRHFRILVADTVLLGVLIDGIRSAAGSATNVTFDFVSPKSRVSEALERADVDILIVPEGMLAPDHPSAHLFEEGHSVIACASNDALEGGLNLDTFAAAGHVEVAIGSSRSYLAESLCAEAGVVRRIEVTVDNFLQVPFHVSGTRRIATMPSRTAEFFSRIVPLRTFEPPLAIAPARIAMQWHRAAETDPAILWLRSLLIAAA